VWTVFRRGIAARRGRTVATGIAVAAAVAFLSGTFVLTDTIDAGVRSSAAKASGDVAAIVTDSSGLGESLLAGEATLPSRLVTRIRQVPGVTAAEGISSGYATPLDGHGHPVSSTPGVGVSIPGDPRLRPVTLRDGRWPLAGGEIVVDGTTAGTLHVKPGGRLRIALASGARDFTVTGTIGFGTAGTVPGLSIVGFTPGDAASALESGDRFSAVEVAGGPGTAGRVRSAIGGHYTVRSAREQADHVTAAVTGATSVIGAVLTAFATIALVVAALLIANTFAVSMAQRTRELALLRCVGAGRAQTGWIVLAEAAAIGVAGGAAGLLGGLGLAVVLRAGLGSLGLPLPDAATTVTGRTVVVSLLVGAGVTMVSALTAAVRAARSRPLSALTRDERAEGRRTGLPRRIIALITVAGGAFLLTSGPNRGAVALGGLVLLVGAGLAGPMLLRPATAPARALLSLMAGVCGRLAGRQLLANRHRSTATAGTLAVAVSTVTIVATLASCMASTASIDVRRSLRADYIISTDPQTGVEPALADRIARLPGVTHTVAEPCGVFHAPGDSENVCGVDPSVLSQAVNVHVEQGSLAGLKPDTIAVSARVAAADHFHLGQTIPITLPNRTRMARIVALYTYDEVAQYFLIPMTDYERDFPVTQQADHIVMISTAPSARSQVHHDLASLLAAYPQAHLDDRGGYGHRVNAGIDLVATIATGLLALSLLIGLISIITTLTLSVLQRTREIGLLRAVGAETRQIRILIRAEALATVTTGALCGVVLGLAIGWPLARALDGRTLGPPAFPTTLLTAVLPAAVLAGLLAAAIPARRATSLDPLTALHTE
jgi:putative ABC transport system permease protein